MNLNDREWKEFKIGDLFILKKGKCSNANILKNGNIPYIGATNRNNGVLKFSSCDNNLLSDGNCIVFIGAGDGSAGYSVYKYEKSINSSSNICGYNKYLNKYIGLFISCSSDLNQSKYSHGYSRNLARLSKDKILLPTTPHGEPDYHFMENYIKELIHKKRQQNIEYITNKLKNIEDNNFISLNKQWKEFRIKDLFNVYTGGDLIINKIKSGNIPIISHSSENNGIVAYSSLIHNRKIFNYKKTISLADRGNFKAFIQKINFYIGTRVKALEIKYNISYFSLLFIANEIDKQSCKFSYGYNACNNIDNLKFLLPINSKGEPDYEFMGNYIKNIMIKKYNNYLKYIENAK